MSPNTKNNVEITTAEDFTKAMEAEHDEKQKDWQARRDMKHAKITDHERRVIDRLAVAWNEYNALQPLETEDKAEFRQCINRAAAIIAVRVARRVNPECWTPDPTDGSLWPDKCPQCGKMHRAAYHKEEPCNECCEKYSVGSKSQRIADESADGKPDGQEENEKLCREAGQKDAR